MASKRKSDGHLSSSSDSSKKPKHRAGIEENLVEMSGLEYSNVMATAIKMGPPGDGVPAQPDPVASTSFHGLLAAPPTAGFQKVVGKKGPKIPRKKGNAAQKQPAKFNARGKTPKTAGAVKTITALAKNAASSDSEFSDHPAPGLDPLLPEVPPAAAFASMQAQMTSMAKVLQELVEKQRSTDTQVEPLPPCQPTLQRDPLGSLPCPVPAQPAAVASPWQVAAIPPADPIPPPPAPVPSTSRAAYGSSEYEPVFVPSHTDSAFSSGTLTPEILPEKLNQKIWNDQYVDFFDVLFPDHENYGISLRSREYRADPSVNVVTKKRRPLTELEWCRAFDQFMLTYLSKFPSSSKDLILYGTFIKDLMVMKANWNFYDCAFRKGREAFKYSWCLLRQDLHFKATNPSYPLFNDPRTPPAPRGSFQQSYGGNHASGPKQPYGVPPGYCFAFNTSGKRCSNGSECSYKHQCPKCQGNHPGYLHPKGNSRGTKPSGNVRTSREFVPANRGSRPTNPRQGSTP